LRNRLTDLDYTGNVVTLFSGRVIVICDVNGPWDVEE
jgi:hypothetical protein